MTEETDKLMVFRPRGRREPNDVLPGPGRQEACQDRHVHGIPTTTTTTTTITTAVTTTTIIVDSEEIHAAMAVSDGNAGDVGILHTYATRPARWQPSWSSPPHCCCCSSWA